MIKSPITHRLLPTSAMSETSIKIKIQHDDSIHQGVCGENCPHKNVLPRSHLKVLTPHLI